MHTWTATNWMKYSTSHVALLLSKMASEAISEHLNSIKISWGSMPPDPPSLACLCTQTCKPVTPLLQILPTGLVSMYHHLYMPIMVRTILLDYMKFCLPSSRTIADSDKPCCWAWFACKTLNQQCIARSGSPHDDESSY